LIQGFETWGDFCENMVFETYKFDLRKIVISDYLKEKVESVGEHAIVINNGFDFTYFKKP
jgi:hypothetical protein